MAQWYTWLGERPSWLQMWRLTMVPMTACRGAVRCGKVFDGQPCRCQANLAGAGVVRVAGSRAAGNGSWQVQAISTSPVIQLGVDIMFSRWRLQFCKRECRCSTETAEVGAFQIKVKLNRGLAAWLSS